MAEGLYVSMAGATARERQLESIADDLANAQTPGFKAERPAFVTVLAEAGGLRAYPAAVGSGSDLRPGPVVQTSNPLDVLPDDGNFLGVRNRDGKLAFTRDGRLSLDADGTLRAAGLPVLTDQLQTVSLRPEQQLQIGADGRLLVDDVEVGHLALYKLEGHAERLAPALVAPAEGGSATAVSGGVKVGAIEQGNRSPMEGMLDMVSAQRSFDASMQAIDTYRRLSASSSELGRVR
jgi:flagellar basal-body rod protein FlgF